MFSSMKLTSAAQQLGKKGGKARAAKYDRATLSEWAKKGGRPRKDAQARGDSASSAAKAPTLLERFLGGHSEEELRHFQEHKGEELEPLRTRILQSLSNFSAEDIAKARREARAKQAKSWKKAAARKKRNAGG